ncbi:MULTISPECIES: ADP-ribosyltransferase-containing protein [Ectopseudomonas]|uniref:Uncharacterized protein n=2 Tax=Ectopseudomonas TaxID=3236654 RepID=A0A1G6Q6Z0_9GAMM|nr:MULTISPECIES: LPD23 domain-containing protein [Pseudomonas]ALN21713.1 hypothetical protein DW68_023820 [Pseudomonas mendocina S5.2]KER98220.1 hypothetical protein HN51_25915 [Pseudomonas mendocina]MBP3062115.1 hypothetical protein [Pseudomonas chengduensis]NNB75407.1 hypothetical protein [Pseudomonas chengduensis]OEO24342.1 hypothetical protein AX279_16860 [Pseudomonas sp. J237]
MSAIIDSLKRATVLVRPEPMTGEQLFWHPLAKAAIALPSPSKQAYKDLSDLGWRADDSLDAEQRSALRERPLNMLAAMQSAWPDLQNLHPDTLAPRLSLEGLLQVVSSQPVEMRSRTLKWVNARCASLGRKDLANALTEACRELPMKADHPWADAEFLTSADGKHAFQITGNELDGYSMRAFIAGSVEAPIRHAATLAELFQPNIEWRPIDWEVYQASTTAFAAEPEEFWTHPALAQHIGVRHHLLDALSESYWLIKVEQDGVGALVGIQQDQLQRRYLDSLPLSWMESMASKYGLATDTLPQIRHLVDAWMMVRLGDSEVLETIVPAMRATNPEAFTGWPDDRLLALWRASFDSAARYAKQQQKPGYPDNVMRSGAVASDNTAELMANDLRRHYGGQVVDGLLNAGKLVLVDSIEQLPPGLLSTFTPEQLEQCAGATTPDRTIYLVANRIERDKTVGLFLHEVGEHAGLASMLGDDYGRLCRQFDKLLQAGDTYATWAAMRVPRSTENHQIPSERLAYLVERVANERQAVEGGEGGHALGNEVLQQLRTWLFRTDTCRWLDQAGLLDDFRLNPFDMATLARQAVDYYGKEVLQDVSVDPSWIDRLDQSLLDTLFLATTEERQRHLSDLPAEDALAFIYSMSALNAPAIWETLDLWADTLHTLAAQTENPALRSLAIATLDEGRRIETQRAASDQFERQGFAMWVDDTAEPDRSKLYFLAPSAKFADHWQLNYFGKGQIGDTQYQSAQEALRVVQASAFVVPDAEAPAVLQRYATAQFRSAPDDPIEAFKQWFGDSKVLDDEGRPLVMYHATYAGEIDVFDRLKSTEFRRASMDTVGIWFSDNPGHTGAGIYASGPGAAIYPVFLRAERTKYYDRFDDFLRDMHEAEGRRFEDQSPKGIGSTEGLRAKLKAQGYDSIGFTRTFNGELEVEIGIYAAAVERAKEEEYSVPRSERQPYTAKRMRLEESLATLRAEQKALGFSTEFDGQNVIAVFEPDQIKSAVGNNGDYSLANPSIMFRLKASDEELAFARWFGNSKVVDAGGKPLVVYKGGPTQAWQDGSEITVFDSPNGPWAGFFTSDKNVASRFAEAQWHMTSRGGQPAGVFPVYLKIERPLVVDAAGRPARDFQIDASVIGKEDSPLREELLSGNYDGLILKNTADEGDVLVPLSPEQVKSAIGNNGNFDPSSTDIRFKLTLDAPAQDFEAWFGNSKVADSNGLPLPVFHGTEADFAEFRGDAIFFAGTESGARPYGSNVIKAFLSLQNPYVVDYYGQGDNDIVFDVEEARDGGHDGLIVRNAYDGHSTFDQYVAFDPGQIRIINSGSRVGPGTGRTTETLYLDSSTGDGTTKVLKNPSRNQALAFAKQAKYQDLRGIVDPATGNLFLADANAVDHKMLAEGVGLEWEAVRHTVDPVTGSSNRLSIPATAIEFYPRNIFADDSDSRFQFALDREQAFSRWFADSKVVRDGKPLVVYHGTASDFDSFDPKKVGSTFGYDEIGFFFTDDRSDIPGGAGDFAIRAARYAETESGANILPVYLSLQNPYTLEQYAFDLQLDVDSLVMYGGEQQALVDLFDQDRSDIMRKVIDGNYDGIAFEFGGDSLFVALHSEQIKSAIGNVGTFDPTNPDIRFSFAGPRAMTASGTSLVDAIKRLADGHHVEDVRQETGWFQGVDGKWRFEIDDSDARIKLWGEPDVWELRDANGGEWIRSKDFVVKYPHSLLTQRINEWQLARTSRDLRYPSGILTIGDILDHPRLFQAYPWVADIDFVIDDSIRIGDAEFVSSGNGFVRTIRMGFVADPEVAKSAILHEIQHAIQEVEGFARGGDPDEEESKATPEQVQEWKDALTLRRLTEQSQAAVVPASALSLFEALIGRQPIGGAVSLATYNSTADLELAYRETRDNALSPTERYLRLAGEVEARNTQARIKLTEEERRLISPSVTQSVPDGDIIVTGARQPSISFVESLNGTNGRQLDLTLEARVGGETVGRIDYSILDGRPSIQMIEVEDKFRRQGYATQLIQQLQRRHPESSIDFGMLTPDGAAWFDSLPKRIVPTAAGLKKAELDQAQIQRDELLAKAAALRANGPSIEKKAQLDELVEPLNDLHDLISDLEQEVLGEPLTDVFIETGAMAALMRRIRHVGKDVIAGAGRNLSFAGAPGAQFDIVHIGPAISGMSRQLETLQLQQGTGAAFSITDLPGVHLGGSLVDLQARLDGAAAEVMERAEAQINDLRSRLEWLKSQRKVSQRLVHQTQSALANSRSCKQVLAQWASPSEENTLAWGRALTPEQTDRIIHALPECRGMTGAQAFQALAQKSSTPHTAEQALLAAGFVGIRDEEHLVLWDKASIKMANELEQWASSSTRFHLAYHGTRHDVDQFSLDHVGTGEGAQAFGYGLYFAQSKMVAKQYQTAHHRSMVWYENELFPNVRQLTEAVLPGLLAQTDLNPEALPEAERLLRQVAILQQDDPAHAAERIAQLDFQLQAVAKHLTEGMLNVNAHSVDRYTLLPAGGARDLRRILSSDDKALARGFHEIECALHWHLRPGMSEAQLNSVLAERLTSLSEVQPLSDELSRIERELNRYPGDGYLVARHRDVERAIERALDVKHLVAHYPDLRLHAPIGAGNLYMVEVSIKPDEYLVLEAPLSQQSSLVKTAFNAIIQDASLPVEMRDHIARQVANNAKGEHLLAALSGRESIYLAATESAEQQATQWMLTHGIQGVRYADGITRKTDGSSCNFVVFDESRISILGHTDKLIRAESDSIPVYDYADIDALEQVQLSRAANRNNPGL